MSNSEVFKSLLKDIKEALIEDAIEKYNQQGEGLNHFKEMYSRLKNYYEDNSNINDILNTVKLTLIDFDKNVKINQYCEEDIKLVHNQFKKILEIIAIIEKSNRLLISKVIEKEDIISFCKRLEKVIDDSNKFKLEI